jgi:Baseplate J-like protein
MAMRVLYLDVDDEITSAASRIRSAEEIRVAVVLPYGSRVATSRINFRLLARDATLNGKRLSIIAGDSATRALAASAGLPIYASVAEYESSLEAEKAERAETGGREGAASEGGAAAGTAAAAATSAAATEPVLPAPPARTTRGGSRRKSKKPPADVRADDAGAATAVTVPPFLQPALFEPGPDPTSAAALPTAAGASAVPGAAAIASAAAKDVPVRSIPEPRPPVRTPAVVPASRVIADSPSRPTPFDRSFGPLSTRMPIIIGAAVLALAVVVGGVGAYLLLPTATVVITPREASIGPIELRITASPSITEPDQAADVVPALSQPVDVEASQSFPVTGKRVVKVPATGTVRFRNFDAGSSNTIPRGSIVSTRSGVRFKTDRAVTVKRAEQVLFQVFPSAATVTVTAVEGGPQGNVDQNAIRVIPRGEDPQTLDVTNPDATKGGKRDEFPRVAQADIDKATAAVRAQLTTKFQQRLADPALAAEGTTVFPETALLGDPTYTVDPASLLGDEVATFELGASASGTVLAVDESAVQAVAAADIATHVEPGYALLDRSSTIDSSPGVVDGGVITFPVVITAREVLQLDTAAIEAEIRGKPLAEAQVILQRYGTAEVSVWPDWVGTIPTLDARVDVRSTAPRAVASP